MKLKLNLTAPQIKNFKRKEENRYLSMLTCYDYQSAQMLAQTDLDIILVGDSLGNVILGHDTTTTVTLDMMTLFCQAVRKGAPEKFLIGDVPFGVCGEFTYGLNRILEYFQRSQVNAVKIEGACPTELKIIQRLSELGVPVIGHIGLTPQSVHGLGGYYTHGKNENDRNRLRKEAQELQAHGCIAVVGECLQQELAQELTESLTVPLIGIGCGPQVDGQVLVLNDLLHLGPDAPPKFCRPEKNFFEEKKKTVNHYLNQIHDTKTITLHS